MAWNYSFGIYFSNIEEAEKGLKFFKDKPIELSNLKKVILYSQIMPHLDSDNVYILGVGIDGLSTTDTNLELFKFPYFYEIRDYFYKFLLNKELNFEFAHYELEAADNLGSSNPIEDVNYFIENYAQIPKGDYNAKVISGIEESYFLPKNFIDGMVISEENYKKLDKNQLNFKIFKNGYYWLPIPKFPFSN